MNPYIKRFKSRDLSTWPYPRRRSSDAVLRPRSQCSFPANSSQASYSLFSSLCPSFYLYLHVTKSCSSRHSHIPFRARGRKNHTAILASPTPPHGHTVPRSRRAIESFSHHSRASSQEPDDHPPYHSFCSNDRYINLCRVIVCSASNFREHVVEPLDGGCARTPTPRPS